MRTNWPPTIEQVKEHQENPWAGYKLRNTYEERTEDEKSSLDFGIAAALAAAAIIAISVIVMVPVPDARQIEVAGSCVSECARLKIDLSHQSSSEKQ